MTDHESVVPKPLNPRDPPQLTQELSAGDRVRITTTQQPRTICTVAETNPVERHTPLLVLKAPPLTTTGHDTVQQAFYHCSTSPSAPTMTVVEYTHTQSDTTAHCIGTLTTIAHLPRLSTDQSNDEPPQPPAEVATNE